MKKQSTKPKLKPASPKKRPLKKRILAAATNNAEYTKSGAIKHNVPIWMVLLIGAGLAYLLHLA